MGVTMNLEIGEVLSRAWQIIWKHKVLWAMSLLPFLISILFLPIWLILVFQRDFDIDQLSTRMQSPVFTTLAIVFYLAMIVASIFLQIASRSSVTLGIYRAEAVRQPFAFMDLLKDGLQYFWRIMGMVLLIGAGIIAAFIAFFLVLGALSFVTMGLAALCMQPLFFLLIPFMWLVMAFMEQSESAIIADGMSVMGSIQQAYALIKANIWKYVLLTIILYVGVGLLTSLVMVPLMIPMFIFMTRNFDASMDFNHMLRLQAVFGMVVLPIMIVIQSLSLTYIKSVMVLVYLRLTRPAQPLPVLQEAAI
jgi:hypothetical protein